MQVHQTVLLALLAMGCTACATTGRKIDATAVDQIQTGKTTKQEVLKSIGSPDQISRNGHGDTTFMYMYARTSADAKSFIPIVGGFMGGSHTQNQSVIITFGPDNIVKDLNSTMGGMESGEDLNAGSKARIDDTENDKRAK